MELLGKKQATQQMMYYTNEGAYTMDKYNPYRFNKKGLEQQVLGWVNDIRSQNLAHPLDQLPRGYARDKQGCVIANSLKDIMPGVMVAPGIVDVPLTKVRMEPPEFVNAFIVLFDMGELEHLEQDKVTVIKRPDLDENIDLKIYALKANTNDFCKDLLKLKKDLSDLALTNEKMKQGMLV